MGRIQSSTGLTTGIDIQGIVTKLMQIESIPRDALTTRQASLKAQQAAVTDLTAVAIGVQLSIRRLSKPELFTTTKIASSNPSMLTANSTATVAPGQYQFVPARLAQASHAISSGVAASDDLLGEGSLSFRFGGQIDTAVSLSELNGGAGVPRGQIRVTDRSGATGVIDLRYAQNIDDVLTAINESGTVSVEATAQGDRLVITDRSGGTANLRVQEVGGGTTAAGLGLAGINVAADTANGQDIVKLFEGIQLNRLRDGNGLSLRPAVPELSITYRDGSTKSIDLDPTGSPTPRTLGDILDVLNAADPTKLEAKISADGERIELTDLTSGGGNFIVASAAGGTIAEELGLAASVASNTLTGSRIVSGLKTTLITSLSGGDGLGTLGTIALTDRSGATVTVDLSTAETLDDVIDAINDAGLDITATYNDARNGLKLTDTSGATTGNLIVADGDANNAATKLGLAANVAATSINSGALQRQSVGRATLLSSYNGSKGVSQGSFKITNSLGATGTVNLTTLKPKTVGDIIDAINGLNINVTAQINAAGDGIELVDGANGTGKLTVADQGTGRAAADLHLAGEATGTTLNGSTTITINVTNTDTLESVIEKINDLKVGVTAGVLNDGSGSLPAHLSLLSSVTGSAASLQIDGSGLGLSFRELTKAQDAVLQLGSSATTGTLIASASNSYKDIVPGLNVSLAGAGTDVVTVTASQTGESAASALQLFVDQYNKLRTKLDTYTNYNVVDGTVGALFGSSEALRLDSDLARAVGGTYFNGGTVRSLAQLGVTPGEDGKLTFDKSLFEAAYNDNPADITEFFSDETRGFAQLTDKLMESLVGKDDSVLITRFESLQRQVDTYTNDIEKWGLRLTKIQERLFNQFFQMESIVTSIRNNLTAISQIQYISPVSSSSNS